MALLIGNGKAKMLFVLLLFSLIPFSARADVYKCVKGGSVTFQDTPCEGANVKSTHIEDRDSGPFVGCFATTDTRVALYYEVRANGAGTYQLIDERNPLNSGVVLKRATDEELQAVSTGLHIRINDGLTRYVQPPPNVYASTSRYGYRYAMNSTPVAQPITASSLYGIYQGVDAEGKPIILIHSGGGVPQPVEKTGCPEY